MNAPVGVLERDEEVRIASVAAARDMVVRVWKEFAPRARMSISEWAERYRWMSSEETELAGRYSLDVTPAIRPILDCASDPKTRKIVVMKAAQIAYTSGVLCNVLGYFTHQVPRTQMVVFPREKSAKDFAAEKFDPMVRATPALSSLISLKSRAAGNSTTRKHFPGGLIKLVGSNSPSDVKSTSAGVLAIEEPDDVSQDIRGQGDGGKLAEERTKTYENCLILIGGTPTAKGASSIEEEFNLTDQRRYFVDCPHCGESQVMSWDQVIIPEDVSVDPREVYGHAQWERACMSCGHCGALWTEEERKEAVRTGHWQATARSHVAGYHFPEFLSLFGGSEIPILARKYLEAQHKLEQGDATEMVAFWNSSLALPWEYRGELPEEDELRNRAEPYHEWTVPSGGLVPLMTVDVQHDRLAVTVWVYGRGEECWLAFWGELYGTTMVAHAGAWEELEQMMARTVRHATGVDLPIAAIAIDSADGQTSDAVYAFVRKHNRIDRPVIAVRGAPDDEGRTEIWTPPKRSSDPGRARGKADKYGVQVHVVGTARAKDLILGFSQNAGRIRLTGNGDGRMHFYQAVRPDFYEQILSEIKVPSRNNPRKRTWKHRSDRRNEALDCTVYALYLSRVRRLHLRRPAEWDLQEMLLRQGSLVDAPSAQTVQSQTVEPDLPEARGDPETTYRSLLEQMRRERRA